MERRTIVPETVRRRTRVAVERVVVQLCIWWKGSGGDVMWGAMRREGRSRGREKGREARRVSNRGVNHEQKIMKGIGKAGHRMTGRGSDRRQVTSKRLKK